MNKLFGFLKQKITEVKQQNKQELEIIAQSITESDYSKERVMSTLQNAKSNYMSWNILIANQASTGLYYSQLHNKNICLRKIKGNDQLQKKITKNKMKLAHIKQMHEEIKEINSLNGQWVGKVNSQVDQLLRKTKFERKTEKQSEGEEINENINLSSDEGIPKQQQKNE